MQLIVVILDSHPAYLEAGADGLSLLSLPLGTGTVYDVLAGQIREAGAACVHVLPGFSPGAGYARRFVARAEEAAGAAALPVNVLTSSGLSELLHSCEPSDDLVIIDPRYWPVGGFDLLELIEHRDDRRWTVHAVAVASDSEEAQEYVRLDAAGRVRCIRRYYESVTWPKTGPVLATVMPASAAEDVMFSSLGELRHVLSLRGMLSRDLHAAEGSLDLMQEEAYLALQEEHATARCAGSPPPGFRFIETEVLASESARVHPSSRIRGPVVLQAGTQVDEGATLIGPSVVGRGARLRRDAFVAQSAIAERVTVGAGQAVRHQVLARTDGSGSAPSNGRIRTGDGSSRGARGVAFTRPRVEFNGSARTVRRRVYPAVKLTVEAALAWTALIALLPLFLVIALLIRLDSAGPIFFRDRREGKGGRMFDCLKFRTMRPDAHLMQRGLYDDNAVDGPQFKMANDPRVTRVGRWLRQANLDELPQLINVALGQMSLVGPRPSPFRENQICVPWRRARLSVRPGITGLWQVCRHDRDEGDFHQWIAYDIAYVRHQSFLLDLRILFATILTLGGKWHVSEGWILGTDSRRERLSVERGAA